MLEPARGARSRPLDEPQQCRSSTKVGDCRDPELNTEVVVLTEHLDGSGRRIELQRTCSPDEQDRALGQDTYCLVTESGATHYGGVDHWAAEEGRLRRSPSTAAATALRLDTALSIRLPPDDDHSTVVEVLAAVVGDDHP